MSGPFGAGGIGRTRAVAAHDLYQQSNHGTQEPYSAKAARGTCGGNESEHVAFFLRQPAAAVSISLPLAARLSHPRLA